MKADGSIAVFEIINDLEKSKGFKISQNRISYLDPEKNLYEFCWCFGHVDKELLLPKRIYQASRNSVSR